MQGVFCCLRGFSFLFLFSGTRVETKFTIFFSFLLFRHESRNKVHNQHLTYLTVAQIHAHAHTRTSQPLVLRQKPMNEPIDGHSMIQLRRNPRPTLHTRTRAHTHTNTPTHTNTLTHTHTQKHTHTYTHARTPLSSIGPLWKVLGV